MDVPEEEIRFWSANCEKKNFGCQGIRQSGVIE